MNEALLEIRQQLKERKPIFIRQDNPKRKKLNYKWRKPKGIHSKIRHKFKGRRKMPSPGYKSPAQVRGLHASGLKIILTFSAKDVEKIKKDKEGIVVPKSIGAKKRLEILRKAKELDLKVLNLNVDETIKKIEDFIGSKKKPKKEEIKEKKETKQKEIQEKESEEKISENLTDEQKKEAEKKERDKVLTKKV